MKLTFEAAIGSIRAVLVFAVRKSTNYDESGGGAPPEKDASLIAAALDELREDHPQELTDWRVSIVDFLKLLGRPSDFEARKVLWDTVTGEEVPQYTGSVEQNELLTRRVFEKLRKSGIGI